MVLLASMVTFAPFCFLILKFYSMSSLISHMEILNLNFFFDFRKYGTLKCEYKGVMKLLVFHLIMLYHPHCNMNALPL